VQVGWAARVQAARCEACGSGIKWIASSAPALATLRTWPPSAPVKIAWSGRSSTVEPLSGPSSSGAAPPACCPAPRVPPPHLLSQPQVGYSIRFEDCTSKKTIIKCVPPQGVQQGECAQQGGGRREFGVQGVVRWGP